MHKQSGRGEEADQKMSEALYIASMATGIVVTISGLLGIQTENIYRALVFLALGIVAGFLVFSVGVGQSTENPVTVLYVAIATALGSGLTVLFLESETKKPSNPE
jgi:hypothetical protein